MHARIALGLVFLCAASASASAERKAAESQLQSIPTSDIDRDAVAAQTPSLSTPRRFIAFIPVGRTEAASAREPISPPGERGSSLWVQAKKSTSECIATKVPAFSKYGRILGAMIGGSLGTVLAAPTIVGTAAGSTAGALGGAIAGDLIARTAGYTGCVVFEYSRTAIGLSP